MRLNGMAEKIVGKVQAKTGKPVGSTEQQVKGLRERHVLQIKSQRMVHWQRNALPVSSS